MNAKTELISISTTYSGPGTAIGSMYVSVYRFELNDN